VLNGYDDASDTQHGVSSTPQFDERTPRRCGGESRSVSFKAPRWSQVTLNGMNAAEPRAMIVV
jgi:hypothetical protein